jgi:hypothetical protein
VSAAAARGPLGAPSLLPAGRSGSAAFRTAAFTGNAPSAGGGAATPDGGAAAGGNGAALFTHGSGSALAAPLREVPALMLQAWLGLESADQLQAAEVGGAQRGVRLHAKKIGNGTPSA